MADTAELIVEFSRGVPEAMARALVLGAGARVRRRMRSDYDNQVTLLVRIAGEKLEALKSRLDGAPTVHRTEVNGGDYTAS